METLIKTIRCAIFGMLLGLFAGCATPITYQSVFRPDGALLAPCPNLPTLKKGATMGDLVLLDLRTVELYKKCAAKHNGLIGSYNKYLNLTAEGEK